MAGRYKIPFCTHGHVPEMELADVEIHDHHAEVAGDDLVGVCAHAERVSDA